MKQDPKPTRQVRVRIAPSPTGNAHVGTARNALYNLLYARQHAGAFVLRIDDTDMLRSTQESEQGVYEALRWLGLHWDEGPDVGGPYGPYRQSERQGLYREAAHRLLERGRAYRCFCTPDALEAERRAALRRGQPPRYNGRCRGLVRREVDARLRSGAPHTIRFAIEPRVMRFADLVQGELEQDASLLGDPVIVKSDGTGVYSFATVVDEHEMAISHVIRSVDHISNTFPQLQFYDALGYEPPAFAHVGLLLNPDRSRISKRAGAVYIGEFRDEGYLPEAMVNHLALSGWSPGTDREVYTLAELEEAFSLERCAPANAIYDRQKLLWLNGYWLRRLDAADLARRARPFMVQAGLLGGADSGEEGPPLREVVALEQERLKTLAELPERADYYYAEPDPSQCVALLGTDRFARRHPPEELCAALDGAAAALAHVATDAWGTPTVEAALEGLRECLGWARGEVYMPVRIAVSGRTATPSLHETLVLLGRDRVVRRLRAVALALEAPPDGRRAAEDAPGGAPAAGRGGA